VTARLERIVVHPARGKPVPAKFVCTLSDYGGLLATLGNAAGRSSRLLQTADSRFRDTLLLAVDIAMKGEARVAYFSHDRLAAFGIGWKQRVYPEIPGGMQSLFLFDRTWPWPRCPSLDGQGDRTRGMVISRNAGDAVAYVQEALADLPKQADRITSRSAKRKRTGWHGWGSNSRPSTASWPGPTNVSDLTGDGQMGGLSRFVHPDSPAHRPAIEAGYILLRLHVEAIPSRWRSNSRTNRSGGFDFPWDRLSEVPAEYLDQLPKPWPNAENSFTRALTDLGFSKKYTAESSTTARWSERTSRWRSVRRTSTLRPSTSRSAGHDRAQPDLRGPPLLPEEGRRPGRDRLED